MNSFIGTLWHKKHVHDVRIWGIFCGFSYLCRPMASLHHNESVHFGIHCMLMSGGCHAVSLQCSAFIAVELWAIMCFIGYIGRQLLDRNPMMTLSNGNIFCVTGHLCGEFTGPGDFPAQRQVTRSFDVSLICARINGWVNNGEAGDLRRHRAHYDVIVMPSGFDSRCGNLCEHDETNTSTPFRLFDGK